MENLQEQDFDNLSSCSLPSAQPHHFGLREGLVIRDSQYWPAIKYLIVMLLLTISVAISEAKETEEAWLISTFERGLGGFRTHRTTLPNSIFLGYCK